LIVVEMHPVINGCNEFCICEKSLICPSFLGFDSCPQSELRVGGMPSEVRGPGATRRGPRWPKSLSAPACQHHRYARVSLTGKAQFRNVDIPGVGPVNLVDEQGNPIRDAINKQHDASAEQSGYAKGLTGSTIDSTTLTEPENQVNKPPPAKVPG